MSETILQVTGLTKHFGGIVANQDVTFSVGEGEIVSIIGPNGAGKSTLFKMICGVRPKGSTRKPDSGTVHFRDQDITALPAHRICRLGLALVFQETEPLRAMSAIENVAVGYLVRHDSYHEALQRAEGILERVGLSHRREATASDLTLAELKRLEIGRALATEPIMLMLDETMAGLTLSEVQEALQLVRRINNEGITIILIEHVLEAVMAVSQRVIVLDQGRKIADESPGAVVKDPAVVKAYLGGEINNA
ncbi:MAG: ABC transporter ATP-binding protein [Spirochaetaceae bacterium]|nr:MAG: ABC transporter ATP-binding protein [Spirochaetaceae bacterium]